MKKMQVSDPRQWGSMVILCADRHRADTLGKKTQNCQKASVNENVNKWKKSKAGEWPKTMGKHDSYAYTLCKHTPTVYTCKYIFVWVKASSLNSAHPRTSQTYHQWVLAFSCGVRKQQWSGFVQVVCFANLQCYIVYSSRSMQLYTCNHFQFLTLLSTAASY